jgi:hypothetical protein
MKMKMGLMDVDYLDSVEVLPVVYRRSVHVAFWFM